MLSPKQKRKIPMNNSHGIRFEAVNQENTKAKIIVMKKNGTMKMQIRIM